MYKEKIKNSVAVMQPYVFPFIGYFQLINSVDHFVFYDDVNFMKKGWINRNRIVINKNDFQFTISLEKISQFRKIKEIKVLSDNKLLKRIEQAYKKAPYFDEVYPLLKNILEIQSESIAHLAGAMGKKIWILLPYFPDFRWMLNRDDSPWYPSAKLYRQEKINNWDSILEKVKAELLKLIN